VSFFCQLGAEILLLADAICVESLFYGIKEILHRRSFPSENVDSEMIYDIIMQK
jgi:hypothetical protein